MNYYFELSESSDDDVIETDDYLEHAASKNPDNQLYVFDRVWKDSEGHWRVDLKNTVTGATATRIGIDPKYEGKPLSFNAVKSTVRYALNNHKIAIKDSEVDKIVYTFMRLAPQFFTETGRSNYTINRGGSKNPKKSTSTLVPQYLKHSIAIDSAMCAVVPSGEELAHFGTLGMKWGVRRYQNPDGTLTEEGKKRYTNKDGSYIDDESRRAIKKDIQTHKGIGNAASTLGSALISASILHPAVLATPIGGIVLPALITASTVTSFYNHYTSAKLSSIKDKADMIDFHRTGNEPVEPININLKRK